jgi:rod shape-determining protein MreD
MPALVAIPVFVLLLILQSAIVSQIPLIYGTADLILLALVAWTLHKRVQTAWHWGIIAGLMVSFVSGLPPGVPLLSYLMVVGLTLMLRRRIWQMPILAMFVATFVGTIAVHFLDIIALRLVGTPLPVFQSLNLITLPSLLLNLLLALPVYSIFNDLANWLHPEELEM